MLQAILLVLALCLDAFFASLAYGAEKIHIPLRSALVIDLIGSSFLALSLIAAIALQQFIPAGLCSVISFCILLCMGVSTLFSSAIKSLLRKATNNQKKVTLRYSGIRFVLDVYLDETKADADHSKSLGIREAVYLGTALSIDSLVMGFASGLAIANPLQVVAVSLVIHLAAILLGCFIGQKLAKKTNANLSWISGGIFVLLAFMKIL